MQEPDRVGLKVAWLAAALSGALLLACGEARQAPADDDEPPAQVVEATDVKEELQEAATAFKAYSFEQKDEFEQWGNEQLAELDSQLAELRAQSERLGSEARQEWDDTLANLESERRALDAKLAAAIDAGSESWSELQSGFTEAREVLGESMRRAIEELEADAAAAATREEDR